MSNLVLLFFKKNEKNKIYIIVKFMFFKTLFQNNFSTRSLNQTENYDQQIVLYV